MATYLRSWGNSKGIRIPYRAIKESGITEEDELNVFSFGEDLIISKSFDREGFEERIRAYAGKMGIIDERSIDGIDVDAKNRAEKVCEEIGMPLGVAINIFLLKLGRYKKMPFELSVEDDLDRRAYMGEEVDYSPLYSEEFFDLIGSGVDDGFDEEPEDYPPEYKPELEEIVSGLVRRVKRIEGLIESLMSTE